VHVDQAVGRWPCRWGSVPLVPSRGARIRVDSERDHAGETGSSGSADRTTGDLLQEELQGNENSRSDLHVSGDWVG
jgi:hypothetical protein